MSGFLRILIYGFAALGLVLLAGGLSVLWALRQGGVINPAKFRALVLTSEEQTWLEERRKRPPETAPIPIAPAQNVEEMLGRIAELANADRASQLVADLRRTRASLDDERLAVERRAAEVAQARADLDRLVARVEDERRGVEKERAGLATEQARWAALQADATKQVSVMDEVEKTRLREQTRLFEQMKDNAWLTLRNFSPKDIARYLALMEPKKAARLLVLAQQDVDHPSLAVAIHQELRRLDLDGLTGDQTARLAGLYALMPASEVVTALAGTKVEDIADLLRRMAADGVSPKKQAEILNALRAADPEREIQVQRLLAAPAKPAPR